MTRCGAVVVALGALGCGSKKSPTEITADGASLAMPAGADATGVTIATSTKLPPELERYSKAIADHFKLVSVVALGPAAMALTSPATLTVKADCKDAVAVRIEKELLSLLASKRLDSGVSVTVPAFGKVAVLCPNEGLVGTPLQVLRGVPELLMRPDCGSYISPESPAVKAIAADPKRFSIDADGFMKLEPKLQRRELSEAGELVKADEVIARGGGDSVNLGVVYASLLAARGYPTMIVGGEHTTQAHSGVTMWVVSVVDGKQMFVDARGKLIPLAAASHDYKLQVHRGCAWYPPNGSTDPDQFKAPDDSSTSLAPTPPPASPDATALLAQRKQLDVKCNHGADKAACMERGKIDDQLKHQLDVLLAQHKDLEAKCKASKDADACAKRDQIAEQGKAIKQQLDAKP